MRAHGGPLYTPCWARSGPSGKDQRTDRSHRTMSGHTLRLKNIAPVELQVTKHTFWVNCLRVTL